MATAEATELHTLRDLLQQLGDIPPERVRYRPFPGTATIADVARNKMCELVDGTLVEKAMGARESRLASYLVHLLQSYVLPRNCGVVLGPDGSMEILTGLVRLPDVAYLSWDRFPGHRQGNEPVPAVVPDLAVEVLSKGNTPAEMARKRSEYFEAGVQVVWMINPNAKSVSVYTAADQSQTLGLADTLSAEPILPGFTIPIQILFDELDRRR